MNVINTIIDNTSYTKKRTRIAVTLFYFSQGLCFATWASRIPDIKSALHLGNAALGTVLFALPLGQLITLPFSGRLVTRYGSRSVLIAALPCYALAMTNMGLATQGWQLGLSLLLFGIFGNLCNIAVNTQGVATEKLYQRPVMASFHGGWSIAGFTGALIGLLMMNLKVAPYLHFWIIAVLVWGLIVLNHRYLVYGKAPATAARKKGFIMPDKSLIQLGFIGFCSMASEGAMFDWSGIYFKEVVKAPASLVMLGYTSFMIMMASGRFMADRLIARFGRKQVMQVCGILISIGLFTSVLFPYLVTCTLGFMLVGLGVSSIVPTVYSVAGTNKKVTPGIALATVSSVSFLGFLMGPPLIGYIAAAAGLRYSYALIGVLGFCISLMVSKVKVIK